MSQEDEIARVLESYVPIDVDTNQHATETMNSVRELLEARAQLEELQPLSEISAGFDVGVIRPGDTVLFSTRYPITQKQAEALKAQLRDQLAGVEPVILDGVRVEAIYRNEEG